MAVETAIILAGGRGARMWPFAEVRSKCAMPVGGVPNIRLLAEALAESGLRRAVVVLGPWGGSVRAALLGAPLEIAYAEQPSPRGTADAALRGLALVDDAEALVLYGDVALGGESLRALLDRFEQDQPAAAALVEPLAAPRRPQEWIGAYVEGDELRGLEGHGRDATHRVCGAFAFGRAFVPFLEANPGIMTSVPVGGMPPAEAELAESLQRFLDAGNPVAAVPAAGPVVDMDKPWHILEANHQRAARLTAALTESRIHPSARVHDGAEIRGAVVLGPGSEIGNRVVVEGNLVVGANTRIVNGAILRGASVIGDECRVSDYCLVEDHTVVGHRCVVGHGAEISGVQFDGSYLWHYCEIFGVVGQAVDIGAATVCGTLRFDDGVAAHRVAGRREVPEWGGNASYFGDFSRTGVNVITQPGVKIGAYACVGAGIVLNEDVPSRTLRLLKQETVDRPWGPERYGW